MPAVIPAAISAAMVYIMPGGTAKAAMLIFALSLASSYLAPEPDAPDFTSENRDRGQTVRSAVTARRIIYGEMVSSGPLVFAASTNENKYLHLVIPVAGHECEAIKSVFLNDQEITEAMLDSDGNVQTGRFENRVRIKKHLGATDQAADSDLVSEVSEWTTDHRLRGVAYIYIRLEFDRDVFATGIPNVKAVVRGKKVYDTRDAATRWSRNPALIARDYLTSSDGIGSTTAEIDDATVTAAANICDEFVTLTSLADTFSTNTNAVEFTAESTSVQAYDEDGNEDGDPVVTLTDVLIRANSDDVYATGDQIQVSTTGSLPGGLSASTNYFVIRVSAKNLKLATNLSNANAGTAITITSVGSGVHTIFKNTNLALARTTASKEYSLGDRVQLTTTGTLPTGLATSTNYYVVPVLSKGADFKLATSLANANTGTVIAISTEGSGTHTVTKTAQLRYVADGSRKLDAKPIELMEHLLSAFSGTVIYTAGQYKVFAGAATTQSASFDEDVLTGSITIQPKFSRRELFNQVRGTHTSPYTFWQETDFPRITNATYIEQDGETITRDIALPWTTDAVRSQRLAKIVLEKSRQSIVVEMPCNLSVLNVSVHDVIRVTNAIFGWTNKEFRVLQMQFSNAGINLTLQEYASTVFDWSGGDETTIDAAPDTTLPNIYDVSAPGGLAVTEELYSTRNSSGVKTRALLSWATGSGNADIISYEVRYKEAGAANYKTVGTMGEGSTEINDLKPRTYLFEVRSVNSVGVRSTYAQITKEITGLLAAPSALTNLSAQSNGGMCLLSWDQSTDLDVKMGGKIAFRHAPAQTGETWVTSQEIGFAVAGSATEVTLPLKAGTYFARPFDSSGIAATSPTSVAHDGSSILAYTTSATATEHTAWAGAKDEDVETSGDFLQLASEDNFDTIADMDAMANFDYTGGVADNGTYTFANVITLGSVTRPRLVGHIKSVIANVNDTIDARVDYVDDWDDIDNALGGDADCQLYFRSTQDDPAGSPTWTGYQKFQATEAKARGFQFQAILTSAEDDWNISIEEMSVKAETI